MVNVLKFRTLVACQKGLKQTALTQIRLLLKGPNRAVQTQIRLLLKAQTEQSQKKQSDKGLPLFAFVKSSPKFGVYSYIITRAQSAQVS